jgi:hypothetical protein
VSGRATVERALRSAIGPYHARRISGWVMHQQEPERIVIAGCFLAMAVMLIAEVLA